MEPLGVRTLVSNIDFVCTVLFSLSSDHNRSAQKFTSPFSLFPRLVEPQCLLMHPKHGWEKPGAVPGSEGHSVQQPRVPHSSHCNNTSFFIFFSQINPLHFRLAGELLFFSVLLLRPLKSQGNLNTKSLF